MIKQLNSISMEFMSVLEKNKVRGYALTLEFESLDKKFVSSAKFSKADFNTSFIAIQLTMNGNPINLEEEAISIYANILKPSKQVVVNECSVLDASLGAILLALKTNSIDAEGSYEFEIIIKNGVESKLVSPFVTYNVYNSLESDTNIPSKDEIKLIDKLINDVNVLKTENQEVAQQLEATNNLINSSEELRVQAESTRVNSEELRVQAEEVRKSQEVLRIEAEKDRVAYHNDVVTPLVGELKETNNSATSNLENLNSSIKTSESLMMNLQEVVGVARPLKESLEGNIDIATGKNTELEETIGLATTTNRALGEVNILATNTKEELKETNNSATSNLENLNSSISSVSQYIETLDRTIETSINKNNQLQNTISRVDSINNDLESNANSANTINLKLKDTIDLANTTKDSLTQAIVTGQVDKLYEEVVAARNEHSNLKERLDHDKQELYESINSSYFLPFKGENITIEHSKVGFTKDSKIEGATYQNLIESRYIYHSSSIEKSTLVNKVNFLKSEETYTLVYEIAEAPSSVEKFTPYFTNSEGAKVFESEEADYNTAKGIKKWVVKFESGFTPTELYWLTKGSNRNVTIKNFMIFKGDYSDSYIPPFFEGVTSVAEKENKIIYSSSGKNLFNLATNYKFSTEGVSVEKDLINNTIILTKTSPIYMARAGFFMKFKPNTDYVFSAKFDNNGYGNGINIHSSDYSVSSWLDKDKRIVSFRTKTQTSLAILFSLNDTNQDSELPINSKMIIKDFFIAEGTDLSTEFKKYEEDKKEILLPYEGGLKGLPNGAKDLIYNKDDGCYVQKNINKVVKNGLDEEWTLQSINVNGFANFHSKVSNYKQHGNPLCNRFLFDNTLIAQTIREGFHLNENSDLYIRIDSAKAGTVETFKEWLKNNPVEIYYELAEPIEHKITDLNSINLETFKDVTYVSSENEIKSNLSFKAPVDIPATISSLKAKNISLEQKNKQLKEEVDTKTLKLHDQDVELTNSDLDLDFRIFELEMSIGLPINLNIKGVKNMARSPFEMMKILILNNNYDRADIEYKAKRYLQGGRMTQEEYDEIIALMDANELITKK